MLFAAQDSNGRELWITDGTRQGTYMLKDIVPGQSPSWPSTFVTLNGKAYFLAADQALNTNVWTTDGTPANTFMVKGVGFFNNSGVLGDLTVYNNKLYFFLQDSIVALYESDGTPSGTHIVKSGGQSWIVASSNFCEYGGKLYFQMSDGINGTQLWYTDGTEAGTQMLYRPEITFTSSKSPMKIRVCNNKMFYLGTDTLHGTELWVSDGSVQGTHMVKDLYAGKLPGINMDGVVYNGKLYFQGYDSTHKGLFSSDGTDTGTQHIATLSFVGTNEYSAIYSGRLYFMAHDSIGSSCVYSTDGSIAGTYRLTDSSGKDFLEPTMFVYDNHLYIQPLFNRSSSPGLIRSDGTVANTYTILKGYINPRYALSQWNSYFQEYKGKMWFGGCFDSTGKELWSFTDSTNSITNISNVTSFSIYPNPNNGNFTINTGNPFFDGIATAYDMTGRVVISKAIHGATHTLQLPIAAKGIYLIKLQSGDAVSTRKILVE